MSDRDKARRALLEKAILDELSEANESTREAVREGMVPGDKLQVPGLGYVQMSDPKPSWRVVDEQAFAAWASNHAPEAFIQITVMSTHWRKQVLRDGEYTDPESGEVLTPDGIGKVAGSPVLSVHPSDAAHELARKFVGAQLELEAGQ